MPQVEAGYKLKVALRWTQGEEKPERPKRTQRRTVTFKLVEEAKHVDKDGEQSRLYFLPEIHINFTFRS